MNSSNFNQMFDPSKAMDVKGIFDEPDIVKHLIKVNKKEAEQIIEENQKTIPPALNQKIQAFIERKRNDGIALERIKRLVKKKFHITVI